MIFLPPSYFPGDSSWSFEDKRSDIVGLRSEDVRLCAATGDRVRDGGGDCDGDVGGEFA